MSSRPRESVARVTSAFRHARTLESIDAEPLRTPLDEDADSEVHDALVVYERRTSFLAFGSSATASSSSLSRGKRNPRSRSKASSSGCIDSMGRIVGRIRSERAHVACHHGVVARRRLYRRMIFLPPNFANFLHGETNMRDVDTPSSHARLMTVVVSPSLQSFMERRQSYMVRDDISISSRYGKS